MTLGLPSHLARDSLSRALAFAGHCAAWVCLGIAVIVGVIGAATTGSPEWWAAVGLSVAMALLLALLARWPTVTYTLLYLMAGTGTVVTLTVLVMQQAHRIETTDNIVLALPRVAIILVGGAGSGSVIAITWATLGYGLGEAASFLGAALAEGVWQPNAAAAIAFGILVVIRASEGLSRRSDARRQVGLHRASQHMREIAIRPDVELRATARLHDTALSHLVAIAAAGSGPVDERLRDGIRHDLSLIVGSDWADARAAATDATRPGLDAGRHVAPPGCHVAPPRCHVAPPG